MSICIKGMKKPRSCDFCPISLPHAEELGCGFDLEHCLITEAPEPHGRLIDASEVITVQVYEDQYEDYRSVSMTIDDLLSQGWIDAEAPTVIEAEEGE